MRKSGGNNVERVFAHIRLLSPEAPNRLRWPQVLEICADYSSRVTELGDDQLAGPKAELSVDLTGTERLMGPPRTAAREIRNRIRSEARLEAVVGLGPTALVARLASYVATAGEVVEVAPHEAAAFVDRLPVEALPGVDAECARRLHEAGIRQVGDLLHRPEEAVVRILGERGLELRRLLEGEDAANAKVSAPLSTAESGCAADSVAGAVDLFPATAERAEVRAALREAAEAAARQLRTQAKTTRQVCLELVFRDMRRVSLRRTLVAPTRSARALHAVASLLFDRTRLGGLQVRRVRVRAARLALAPRHGQLALPIGEPERSRIRRSVDQEKGVRDGGRGLAFRRSL